MAVPDASESTAGVHELKRDTNTWRAVASRRARRSSSATPKYRSQEGLVVVAAAAGSERGRV
jgi:hypothetical protein